MKEGVVIVNDKLIDGFVTELKLQQLKPTTIEQYVRAIKRYYELQDKINKKGVDNFLAEHNHIVNRAAIKKSSFWSVKKQDTRKPDAMQK